MEKNSSFSHLSSADSTFSLPILSPNTLEYYIMNVDTLIDQREQPNFEIAVKKFKEFVVQEYDSRQESCEEQSFMNELISKIFNREEKLNNLTCFVLSEALFDVDIGNKVLKANKIAQEIISIEATENEDVFNCLDRILAWIYKLLASSFHIIVQPLIGIVWRWNDSSDKVSIISSFILLKVLFKRFDFCFKSHEKNIVESIIHGMQSSDDKVRHYALLTLNTILEFNTHLSNMIIKSLCTYFMKVVKENLVDETYGTHNFISMIIEKKPEFKKYLEFKEPPFACQQNADKIQKCAEMSIIPVILVSNNYESTVFENIFTYLAPNIKKRSQTLKEACVCLGKTVFIKKGIFTEQEKAILTPMRSILFKQLDTPFCLYAYLSLLTTNYKNFRKDLIDIGKQPLTKFMIDGLVGCSAAFTIEKSFIQKYTLSIANQILIGNANKDTDLTILAFNALEALNVEEILSEKTFQEFSLNMSSSSLKVREIAADFLLKYHAFKPTEGTAVRLLTIISRESNEKLRDRMITELKKEPISIVLIPCLQNLLVYESKEMKYHVLYYLLKCSRFPATFSTLNEFLSLEIHKLKEVNPKKKPIVRTFLALCNLTQLQETEPQVAEIAHRVLIPFIPPLSKIICKSYDHFSTPDLCLLARIIELAPLQADPKVLIEIIANSLAIHRSAKHVTAGLKLLYAVLHYTNCILDSSIIAQKLFEVALLSNDAEQRYYILKIMSAFGPITPSITNFLILKTNESIFHKTEVSTLKYISLSTKTDPFDILKETSYNVIISSIINLLTDVSLTTFRGPALEALVTILKQKLTVYEQVESDLISCLINFIKEGNISIVSRVISSIEVFANALSPRFKEIINVLVDFACKEWKQMDSIQLIGFSEMLLKVYPDEFEAFSPRISSLFVSEFESLPPEIVDRIICTFVSFGSMIKQVLHIVMPPITTWLINNANDTKTSNNVLQGLVYIIASTHCDQYNSLIMQTLIYIVSVNPALNDKAVLVLVSIAINMGQQFLLYIPALSDTFGLKSHPTMIKVLYSLEEGFPFTDDIKNFGKTPKRKLSFTSRAELMQIQIQNQTQQSQGSLISDKQTLPSSNTQQSGISKIPLSSYSEDDWNTWSNDSLLRVIHSSKSIPINACEILVQKYSPLKEAVFSIALALLYVQEESETNKNGAKTVIAIIKAVISSSTATKFMCSVVLSLLEILEAMGLECPIPLNSVANLAIRSGKVAQGLRALENIYEQGQQNVFPELVKFNRILGRPFSNYRMGGHLNHNSSPTSSPQEASALSAIPCSWDSAQSAFSTKNELQEYSDSDSFVTFSNPLLIELKKYDQIRDMTPIDSVHHAAALWNLNDMKNFMISASLLETDDIDSLFFRACYFVVKHERKKARELIDKAQKSFSEKIIPSLLQEYGKGFHSFASIARLYELEDVMNYQSVLEKKNSLLPELREESEKQLEIIKNKWKSKFKYYAEDAGVLQATIQVHAFVFDNNELHDEWRRLINCLINSNDICNAEQLLQSLEKTFTANEMTFFKAKIEYAKGNADNAISLINLEGEENKAFISRVERTVGIWLYEKGCLNEARERIKRATENDESNSSILKMWASTNFALFLKTGEKCYCIDTFKAAIKGLSYPNEDQLSFLLKTIEILFTKGDEELCSILLENSSDIPVSVWINVLPQLIARSKSHRMELRNVIYRILLELSKKFPHIALSSIMVSLKGKSNIEIIDNVYNRLQTMYPEITEDTMLVTDELIRCAVFWIEMIQKILEDAKGIRVKRLLDRECVFNALRSSFTSINELISQQKEKSFIEVAFFRELGPFITEAFNWFEKYNETKDDELINISFNYYDMITEKLNTKVNQMTKFNLNDISPTLASFFHNRTKPAQVMLPGHYSIANPSKQELIASIKPEFEITNTANRSRKFQVVSSTGKICPYLLKGHEDIRLDERVMQLFTYVNQIVDKSNTLFKAKAFLTTYSTTPLRQDIGIIGVISDTKPLIELIKSYRKKHNITLDAEERIAKEIREDYSVLNDSEKFDVFERSLSITKGNELKQLLLLNSNSSSHWISRRVEYTATLAIGSIAGYILGLGERQPDNILIKRDSARIVHVNFRQIFESANEWISENDCMPFRLTRMMTNALELSNPDGSFRKCCEQILTLFKQNREDILSLLDVFIYDPLLQWKTQSSPFYTSQVTEQVDQDATRRGSPASKIKRIKKKLENSEFSEVETQVGYLISIAADKRNICKMKDSWRPWW